MKNQYKDNDVLTKPSVGFTLIEVMLATVVLAVVIALAYQFMAMFINQYSFLSGQTESVETAHRTLQRLLTEIRAAQPSELGAYTLQLTNDQELSFFVDTDDDDTVELVRYFLDGTELKKGVVEPAGSPLTYDTGTETVSIIADSVVNASAAAFLYYNGDWPQDTVSNPLVPSERQLSTRFIGVDLWVDADNDETTSPVAVSGGVTVRRLKDNN